MNTIFHQGGCQCGAVRFQTPNTPIRAMACHCTSCKQRTGSAFGIGVYFKEQEIEFLQGELQSYTFKSDTTERWLKNEFCAQCGSTVTWTLEIRPGIRGIAGGSYDNPHWYKIEAHIWTRSARADMRYADDIPRYEKAPI